MLDEKPTKEIDYLIISISTLAKEALVPLQSEVDRIIELNLKDEKQIELLLDRLLEFCFDSEILKLYKKLCRYYLYINPSATYDYINYYREMYE